MTATAAPEHPLESALAATVHRTGASGAGIYLLHEERAVLVLTMTCGLPVEFTAPWHRLALRAAVPVCDATREQRLVWIGCHEELARLYPRAAAAMPYPVVLAAAPITGVRRTWGVLLLLFPADHPRGLTSRERAHLSSRVRRLGRLLDAGGHPPVPPDRPLVVSDRLPGVEAPQPSLAAADFADRLPGASLALDLAGRITFASAGAAELLGRPAERLVGSVPWEVLPWLDDPANEDRYRSAVVTREPAAFTAVRPPDRRLDVHLYPDGTGISVRITPAAGSPPAGPAADRGWWPAPGTSTSRVYQLMHLAAVLTEAAGVQDVVDMVTDHVLPAFGADGLILTAVDAGRLRIIGHREYSQEALRRLDGLPLDTGLSPAGRAVATGTPSFFAHAGEISRRYPEAPRITGKQAWAVLPLVISGRAVGCCILSYLRPHPFTADERAVLTSLAGLVAQALDRARLYDAKHELADDLQHALLPHALPRVPGLAAACRYLPATHGLDVGGDFYDLIRLDEHTAAAVIGDVQGHNTTAAALMGQVRTAVHAYAAAGASPDLVLARTNRLLADLEADLLVSCLYVHLDLARHRIALASAGHLPPLVRHPGRRARVLDVEPGPLLGVEPSAEYPVTTAPLPDGTLLTLYTDGLVETPGTDLADAVARLADQLTGSTAAELDRVIDELVRRARPTGRHTDDIALLALRTTGPGG